MIEIQGLKKTFPGGAQAVRGVDLSVQAGELFALLGPNGAGKTTTIRACTTLSGFDDGRITVAGFDVDREPQAVRRAIGYVAQSTGVDMFLTGRENLRLQGQLYRLPRQEIEARTEALADQFDLTGALDRPVSEYSGGMQRKLDIATALIHQPQVLFLDEPTLGLDTASRRALWDLIRTLNEAQGLTILLTTHYLEEADELPHRVAIMHQGEVKVVDTPERLKAQLGGDSVAIEFPPDTPAQPWLEEMGPRLGVRRHIWEGDRLHLYLPDGSHAIPQILESARAHGLTINGITLARPTLDDVFLHFTGASLQRGDTETASPWWEKWAGKGGGRWAKKWQQSAEAGETSGEEQGDWPRWQGGAGEGGEEDWRRWQGGGAGGENGQAWQNEAAAEGTDTPQKDGTQGDRWPRPEGEDAPSWKGQTSADPGGATGWPRGQHGGDDAGSSASGDRPEEKRGGQWPRDGQWKDKGDKG